MGAAEARQIIEAHVASIRTAGKIEEGQAVRTLAGREVQLKNTDRAECCGDNVVLSVENLYPCAAAKLGTRPDIAHANAPQAGDGIGRPHILTVSLQIEPIRPVHHHGLLARMPAINGELATNASAHRVESERPTPF
jgi:hypothetical protein